MKKAYAWLLVAALIGGTVLFVFLYTAIKRREEMIITNKALTIIEIRQLVDEMRDRGTRATPPAKPAAQTAQATDAPSSIALPDRLQSVPSSEALANRFGHPGRGIDRDVKVVKVYEGLLQIIGKADSFTWQVGEILLRAGDWDEAQNYFYHALEEAPNSFVTAKAASRLAWLERDPEKAAYLLELSINEEFMAARIDRGPRGSNVADAFAHILQERLVDAIELCQATGSEALARSYIERLREHFPEAARRFDPPKEGVKAVAGI